MGFKDCDAVLPPSTFFALENDADAEHLVFVGEPIPREEQYRGQQRHRYYFPVVTKDGLQVWGVGSKLYRRLRDAWGDYNGVGYLVTRVGAKGSTETVYGFKKAAMPAVIKAHRKEATPKAIKAFLVEVQTFGEDAGESDDIPI